MNGLSVIIPTLNAAADLPATLGALGDAPDEVIVVDGGSADRTVDIARAAGCRIMTGSRGRGPQMSAGAEAATGNWLLFLHADTVLAPDWAEAARAFMAGDDDRAAAYRYRIDYAGPIARWQERYVAWRSRRGLPYGDQGLLISRAFYRRLGGFRPIPIMEDVNLVRRIGRGRIVILSATATTSARRYRRSGVVLRGARNLFCLLLYFLGTPTRLIARIY